MRVTLGALHNWDELQELCMQIISEEAIHLERKVLITGMNGRENVEFDAMALENVNPRQHPIEGTGTAFVDAVPIVEFAWPIEADAYEKAMLSEKDSPGVVQQRGVRLQTVVNDHARTPVLLLEGNDTLEKRKAHQRRFPTLPNERDLSNGLRFDVLANVFT